MAGLIRTDETASDSGIPGLSEIPVLGRLFSNKSTDNQRTDVILTLTPHIIRNAEITEEDLLPIWVGTEANFSFRGGSPRIESDVEGPFDGTEGTPEEIQDAIRRRIQRLPRGLRPGEANGDEGGDETAPADPQPPRGIDLVPSTPPTDIFKPPAPPETLDPNDPALAPPPVPLGGGGAAALRPSLGAPGAERSAVTRSVALAADTVTGAGTVQLRLAPRQLVVAPGDRFEVRVEVSALAAISHLPFALAFDPAVLAVEKIEAGDFLGTPGGGTAEVLSDASHAGEVVVGASRIGKVPGVAGQGLVARVTFRALAAGSTAVAIRGAKALGPQLDSLGPVETEMAQVQVLKAIPPKKPVKPQPREASRVQRG
jgi:general secretion pathway protein D